MTDLFVLTRRLRTEAQDWAKHEMHPGYGEPFATEVRPFGSRSEAEEPFAAGFRMTVNAGPFTERYTVTVTRDTRNSE